MGFELEEVYGEIFFSWKKFFQSFFPAAIFAVLFVIIMWIINYFNSSGENFILEHFGLFIYNNWLIIVLFILVFSVWDYLFKVFKKTKIRYLAPFFDSISVFFGIWIIGIILNSLRLFIEPENQFNVFLAFLNDLFYGQTIFIFILILLIHYSKFFLKDRKY